MAHFNFEAAESRVLAGPGLWQKSRFSVQGLILVTEHDCTDLQAPPETRQRVAMFIRCGISETARIAHHVSQNLIEQMPYHRVARWVLPLEPESWVAVSR